MCTLLEGVFGLINCFCCCVQEAEWLRGALHQWLDDEYCPEPANEEISRRCAKVYYYCLLEEQVDIGDILMQMVRDLETFSFKESFHGAFSSANAAIELITKRMDQMDNSSSIQQSSSSSWQTWNPNFALSISDWPSRIEFQKRRVNGKGCGGKFVSSVVYAYIPSHCHMQKSGLGIITVHRRWYVKCYGKTRLYLRTVAQWFIVSKWGTIDQSRREALLRGE